MAGCAEYLVLVRLVAVAAAAGSWVSCPLSASWRVTRDLGDRPEELL